MSKQINFSYRLVQATRGLATESNTSIQARILSKLKEKYRYNLIHAEVVNTSWRHDKPSDAETHLELILVTTDFEGKLKANREKEAQDLLKNEIKSLEEFKTTCLTPSKWYDSNKRGLKLPEVNCQPLYPNIKQTIANFHVLNKKN